jgi:hypothetical protein
MDRTTATMRTRWAAIGAAVAVATGAGGLAMVDAAKTAGDRAVYTAIEPCRLTDTRADSTVGTKSSPMGPGEVHTIGVWGANGQCTDIPDDTVAVGLNITALGATLPTHLTIWSGPTGPVPNSSSMNPAPGQPPVPNAVTVDLDTDGRFNVFNLQGNVELIVDLVGIYQDHTHDDRYYTKSQIDSRWSTRVVAQGVVVPTDPDLIVELDTAPRVGVTGSVLSEGRIELLITGVDTDLVPIVMVLPNRPTGRASCTTSQLVTLSATSYRVRVHCYDADDVLTATPFQFLVAD